MNYQLFPPKFVTESVTKFASRLKSQLSRAAVLLVAGCMMLLGTACSSTPPTASGPGATELYRTTQTKEGGMNQYSDTDPRQTDKRLGAETKARVDQAKGNLNKTQSPGDVVDEFKAGRPLGERTKNLVEPAANAIDNLKQDVTAGTERGIKNLQRNTADAKQDLKETLDQAQDNAADLGRDTSRSAQKAAAQVKSQVKSTAENARQDLGDKASNLIEGASRPVTASRDSQTALNALQSETQATPKLETPDLLERVKDSFDTAAQNVGEFAKDAANEAR